MKYNGEEETSDEKKAGTEQKGSRAELEGKARCQFVRFAGSDCQMVQICGSVIAFTDMLQVVFHIALGRPKETESQSRPLRISYF